MPNDVVGALGCAAGVDGVEPKLDPKVGCVKKDPLVVPPNKLPVDGVVVAAGVVVAPPKGFVAGLLGCAAGPPNDKPKDRPPVLVPTGAVVAEGCDVPKVLGVDGVDGCAPKPKLGVDEPKPKPKPDEVLIAEK